jgi:hypothetical protein
VENPLGATSRLTPVNAQPAAAVPRQRRVRGGNFRGPRSFGRRVGALTNSSNHLPQIGAEQVAAFVQLSGTPFRAIASKV